ncbi:ATP-dependent RNA helicase DHX33 [Microcaecilia unicolor]|uniref:ATP-dependent RNA helicase DHX33 n=1 Tax=Microcaecilia unicolor TaxID=1415580 RepID=A0A6P7WLU9_9AMPH|nr:ATP-dependent RNA helicase DHX33 [Microcaecilia unicolor]XP_030042032.1 ATP-dependent RNA helicase DHX33 [Microcaecilia unicolor]XP_030042033.1 ATP-dependent RNA helicase DHX33 [Microcaecilia unicolor]
MPQDSDLPPAKKFKPGSPLFPFSRKTVMLAGARKPQISVELQRRNLPIFQARAQLVGQLRQLDSVVLIGETGSGKTTQVPQYLYEAGIGRQGIIAVTQPRRVAAISLATRVSEEKKTELGKLVGYTVRFEDVKSEETKIKFLTDGMLLREAIGDSLLRGYSSVILDEAHERTVHTDVLFGIVKAAQKKRKELGKLPLKVIIMSATMDVDQFSQYFNGAPVLYLEGRQHPIQIYYTKQPQSDYLQAALISVFQIHQEAPSSQDILVFLTGQEEIEAMTKTCRDIAKHLPDGQPQMMVMPLYASLPPSQQLRVFQGTPKGCRKVILSTNIAETSITITGIKYVIDTGMVKAKKYNPESGLEILAVQRVSKAQAWQRTGRAGREDNGVCYRLYTEDDFEKFDKMTIPEIQRCNLASVMLQLLALKIPNVLTFDFMSKPSPDAVQAAVEQLDLLGAVERKGDQVILTPLGRKMAAFPLEPRFSKTILLSPKFHCTEEILSIISLLSVDSVLYNPPSKRDEIQAVRKKFISSEGDHITLLNIYRAFRNLGKSKDWCRENFVNSRNMATVSDVRSQLRDICIKMSMPIESSRTDLVNIRQCLAHGLFMNTAELQPDGTYTTISMRQPVAIHPSSVLFHCKPACVVYNELLHTSKCYMRDLCVVDADWLYEAAPEYFRRKLKTAKN